MTKPPFLEAKLYINGRKQPLLCNRQTAETLIYEFNRDTSEAAKLGVLFYSCSTILAAFFFPNYFSLPKGKGSTSVERMGVSSMASIMKLHVKECHAPV